MQTDPTLLRYASAITEQKKCWELLAEKFDRFQTLGNNTQQHPTTCKRTQHVTSNNVWSCWPTMLRPFAWGLRVQGAKLSRTCAKGLRHPEKNNQIYVEYMKSVFFVKSSFNLLQRLSCNSEIHSEIADPIQSRHPCEGLLQRPLVK